MIKRAILFLTLLVAPLLVMPGAAGAIDAFDICDRPESSKADNATVCKDKDIRDARTGEQQNPLFGSDGIITTIISILTAIVAIVSVIIIILAGLKFITSGSNPQDVTKAREQIIYAAVGLIVAGIAQFIVRFVIGRI